MNPDQEILIAQGLQSKALLESPAFVRMAMTYLDNIQSALVQTAPHETKKREQLYYLYRAASDIVAGLQQEAHMADQLIAAREADAQE